MQVLAFATFLLLARSASSSCDLLAGDENVGKMDPYKFDGYDDDDIATMPCIENYIISWAASDDEDSANIKCNSGSWAPEPAVAGFSGAVGCVACLTGIADCTDGTCTDGVCVCDDGYKKSLVNPRLCDILQCDALTLSNQVAETAGPYGTDTSVIVTCTDGYHVEGAIDDTVQTLNCNSEGNFDALLKPCVVCAVNDDCTDGTCNANKECECDEAGSYKLNDANLALCEEVTCPDDHCSNNGVCSVKGIELECDCPKGTKGDTCAEFESDPCESDPCKNEGTCARVMTDPTDYTKHMCTCTDDFEGDSCEFAETFHFGAGDKGVELLSTNKVSVEFDVVTAGGINSMYIALLKVTDNDGAAYKVLLLKSDDNTLTLHVIGEDQESVIKIEDLSLTGTAVKVKIHLDSENKLTLSAADKNVATDLVVNDITGVAMGGTGCAWNDDICSFGKSRIFYHSFVGHFGTVSIDGVQQTFSDIGGLSGGKATKSVLDCSAYSCDNAGTCVDSTGQITCTCPSGMEGFACDTYSSGMSFNGYTTHFTFDAVTVPILADGQTVSIDFQKSPSEIGEMVKLKIGECDVVLTAAGETAYKVGDTEVTVAGDTITMVLDGTNVKIDDVIVMACSVEDVLSSAVTVSLGGSDPAEGSDVTLQNSRYQGCISKITFNSMDIMKLTDDANNDADTAQCIADMAPLDPCVDSNPCQNEAVCGVLEADNSATCACEAPFIGDSVCNFKDYCAEGHECDSVHSACVTLETKEKCVAADKEGLKCEEGDRWYYYCNCTAGYMGINCALEDEDDNTEPVKDGSDTTTIIVVVVVVAVVLGVVVTIIIVKKRKSSSGNGTTNGKAEGTYSPQAQEKDLEMSGKVEEGAENPTNLYEAVDVIKNPNAESATEEKEDLPPPPAPADTAITVEPSAPEPIYPPLADDTPAAIVEPAVSMEPAVAVEPAVSETPPSDQV